MREAVCLLIRYHTRPPHLIEGDDASRYMLRLAANGELAPAFTLRALCLLEQSSENALFPINAFDTLSELMQQFHLPEGGLVDMPKLMRLIDRMTAAVPVYRLRCRNDRLAAEVAITYFGL